MKDGWFERLEKVIREDGRAYLAICQAARPPLGPNYIEQMFKRGTKPKLNTLFQLLTAFTPSVRDYVLYGDNDSVEPSRVTQPTVADALKVFSQLPEHQKKEFLQFVLGLADEDQNQSRARFDPAKGDKAPK